MENHENTPVVPAKEKWIALEVFEPLVQNKGWVKFLSIFNIVIQGLNLMSSILSCWGILITWIYALPLWSSISALTAIGDLERGVERSNLNDLEHGARKLGLSIRLLGISTLLFLVLFVLVAVVVGVLVLFYGFDLLKEVDAWKPVQHI